jgi:hypothetical protein
LLQALHVHLRRPRRQSAESLAQVAEAVEVSPPPPQALGALLHHRFLGYLSSGQ